MQPILATASEAVCSVKVHSHYSWKMQHEDSKTVPFYHIDQSVIETHFPEKQYPIKNKIKKTTSFGSLSSTVAEVPAAAKAAGAAAAVGCLVQVLS